MKFLNYLFVSFLLLLSASPAFAQSAAGQTAEASKANGDSVYQQLRRKGTAPDDFNGDVATVNGLVLRRDAATFKFNSGEIYFLTPVEGRFIGAVFLGDLEMTLTPPTDVEKRSLAIFTGASDAPEHFTRLVMRFTDQTFQEIKQAQGVHMSTNGMQSARARDAYHDIQSLVRKQVHYNMDLRTLGDLYAP